MNDCDVLLVEDNSNDVSIAFKALRRTDQNTRMIAVMSGVEALEFLNCTGQYIDRDPCIPPKVILLDLKMPVTTGLDVITYIREKSCLRYTPVVVLTSSSHWKDIQECYCRGANSYLIKPLDYKIFVDMIQVTVTYWVNYNYVLPIPSV